MTSRFDRLGRRRQRRRIGTALIVVAFLAGLAWMAARWRVSSLLQTAQAEMTVGHLETAAERIAAARFWRLHAGRVTEAEGVLALARGDLAGGRDLLQRAREEGVRRSGLDLDAVGRHLSDTARYPEVRALAEHRDAAGGPALPELWRAEAALAGDDLDSAAELLQAASPDDGDAARRQRLQALVDERRGQGIVWTVFDRHGRRLLGRDLASGATVSEVPELGQAPLADGGVLDRLDGRTLSGRVTLTLDLAYEHAAHAALGRYAGAFIAIDPATGAVLALVNHPGPGGERPAFQRLFEPGSIIKMLTFAAALDAGLSLDGLFPLNCTGNMTLDHKVFYDWKVHGTIQDIDEATTVSCNLAFAAMGLELGQARLDDTLRRFGFDASPPSADLALSMGHLLDIDPAAPRRALAARAVGLDNVMMTPLHVAVLAAALANGGTAMRPHLVASRRALGGTTPYAVAQPTSLFSATSAETARRVGEVMRNVTTAPAGTGRRAAVPGLDFALKTGTAGEPRQGLNSIIFGWAPADDPVVAFGFVAEHAGKAELEGARIVRDFLTTVRNEFGRAP